MIKQLEIFSKKIPSELLKEKSTKPYVSKFKKDFPKILAKAKPMFELARKLEKSTGKKKSKKQLAEFRSKFTVR